MTALRATELTFGYRRDVPVLREVSAEIGPGVTVLLGPNGAGKSTLVRVLMGMARAWRGRVEIDGRGVGAMGARERARRMAFVPQRPEVSAAFTVREVVALGRYAIGPSDASVSHAIQRMELAGLEGEAFAALSVGQQQRVTIARALAQMDGHQGGLLLADEPFSAMDPAHCRAAAGVIADLARAGAGVLLVLHDFTLARRVADRAVILGRDGRVAAAGSAGDVLTPPTLEGVFGVPFHECETPGGRALLAAGPV